MKQKQKIDFVINTLLIIIGISILILSLFNFEIKYLFMGTLGLYGILNLIQFILSKKSLDYEGLYTFLASIAILLMTYFLYHGSSLTLALLILGWTTIMAVIKFIKTDYYNDRRDRMWKIRIFTLVVFIITGIISSILIINKGNSLMVVGYFFFIHGILELVDPITKYLLSK